MSPPNFPRWTVPIPKHGGKIVYETLENVTDENIEGLPLPPGEWV